MAVDSNERPKVRQGGTHPIKIDLTRDVDEGDTVSSASITELDTTDLTIGTVTVGSSTTTILDRTVQASLWITATMSGHLSATGVYRLKTVFSTDGGVIDKASVEDYVFDVTGA